MITILQFEPSSPQRRDASDLPCLSSVRGKPIRAMPNPQFEIDLADLVKIQGTQFTVLVDTLPLVGQDESGIFCKLVNARSG